MLPPLFRPILFAGLLSVSWSSGNAQFIDDVKLGLGQAFLGTGDITVDKIEGEMTHKWNRYFSGSTVLGIGY